jgi:hypothetical protein
VISRLGEDDTFEPCTCIPGRRIFRCAHIMDKLIQFLLRTGTGPSGWFLEEVGPQPHCTVLLVRMSDGHSCPFAIPELGCARQRRGETCHWNLDYQLDA